MYYDNVLTLRPPKIYSVCSSEQLWRNVALHLLFTNGSSAVNGCRQNESKQLYNNPQLINTTPVQQLPSCEVKICCVCDKQIHHYCVLTLNRSFQIKYESIHNTFSSEKATWFRRELCTDQIVWTRIWLPKMDWSGVDYCDVFMRCLDSAPIHCRASIAEQMTKCYILQICSHEETNSSAHLQEAWWRVEFQHIFIFGWIVP